MTDASELLRFTTAGSVDDGKSTLIGRLLYDSKSIFEDQLESIERASTRAGLATTNLALLTDGLRAEREQGITIDVAYRYFATPRRRFIIADTPGHVQYTRNMVTGASTADVALILVDARNGVVEQTLRHAYIAKLLGIPHLLLLVNKMDLVDWSRDAYEAVRARFPGVPAVPISALHGDNVVDRSNRAAWYDGPPLLELLETIELQDETSAGGARFPVQYVIRPQSEAYHDYRGYAGRAAGGVFRTGDAVTVLPSGRTSQIASIDFHGLAQGVLHAPLSATITLADDLDASRGDMIVASSAPPRVGRDVEAMLCWFHEKPLVGGGKYALRQTTQDVRAVVREVIHRIDIHSLSPVPLEPDRPVGMNDIVRVRIQTTHPIFFDPYKENRETGSFILIDEATNQTVAGGMIERARGET